MAPEKKRHIVVVGSGPSGLAAAYSAALNGAEVTLLEQMPSCGMKLLASGGGKCNVTNTLEIEEFARTFGRNWRFMMPALEMFHGRELLEFFELHQVKLVKSDGFHYFPERNGARGILNMFLDELKNLGVKVSVSSPVKELIINDSKICGVKCGEHTISADAVILCCGGKSYPALGGLGRGYKLAEQAEHSITPLYPAMTGVKCREEWVKECAGLSLDDVCCFIDTKSDRRNVERGELLFTHNGFSAFAILDLAGRVAELLDTMPTVPLCIDFLPQLETDALYALFDKWRQNSGKKSMLCLLAGLFPRRLAEIFLGSESSTPASRLKSETAEQLVKDIKRHTFNICGVESWDKAMVTKGGVVLREIDSHTLESRKTAGLFFAGELLDITGKCGGFNITWAFASGMCAGTAAASK